MKGSAFIVGKMNVLIVDDSAFMRKLITDLLSESPRLHVVGTARNGADAIKKIKELKPDVVTMDVEMPILNGLEALKIIMKENPLPVVMLSSTTKEGAENTLHAIQLGAIDFITKPSGAISLDLHKVKEELLEKVLTASKVNIKQLIRAHSPLKFSTNHVHLYSRIEPHIERMQLENKKESWNRSAKKIVCIGTSTGGPRALQNVLTKLPKSMDAPILVVQHMPPGFTKSLANRLNALSEISVKEAEDGDVLQKGTAYIAPGGYHLKVKETGGNLIVILDQSQPCNGHRPSVDILFKSISQIKDYSKIAVIMTGMGSDGTEGLIQMKKCGTPMIGIAESKETSIVFGMPKAAIATKLVDEIQNVENIAQTIMKYV